MQFSDLFKKSPKKDPPTANEDVTRAIKPSSDNTFLSPEMQKKRYAAAMEFVKAFQEKIPLVNAKPHAGSVLSVAARLAGTSLFRFMNPKDFTPGVVVLSEEINQAWPQLMNLFALYCKQNGIDVMSKPMITEFQEQDKPRLEVEQVQREYQDQYNEIMKKHGLDYLNSARAGMVVCSILFEYHVKRAKDIDPFVAAGIVAMGIVEGAKTAPLPLGSGASTPSTATEKAKDNSRLVLGERDVAIQEALDHGGVFIDLNPEILRTLQASNIDPYLIYEKAMLQQIEARIPRIDFVKLDVDQLFDEWKSKPDTQAPMYARLILWLKNNANQYGYQQSGNSWIQQ
jgi:hypothetical protein